MLNPASITLGCLESSTLSRDEKNFISAHQPAGVTLFGRNLDNKNSLDRLSLVQDLQELAKDKALPFMVAVDQEGGLVARLKHPSLDIGKAFDLCGGASSKEALLALEKKAYEQGCGLLGLGVNVNFAPVVDVTFPRAQFDQCFINSRAFGASTEEVILRAGAYLSGLEKAEVFGCLKHFPGIGRISGDTHLISVKGEASKKTLWEENLVPFRRLKGSAEMFMVAHCVFPEVCPLEASRSFIWIREVLRKELGFEGLVLCDDLTMEAVIQADVSWEDYVVESVAAGCDLLLICSDFKRWQMACDVLELEARRSPAFRRRVEESSARVQKFRQKLQAL